uniref:TLC domain-containing protein n=1 Tax=Palpitomonas bilix TaxID=652834 RepID=A0A7S3LWU2_9EUKA|mmetsp:Transcript_7884/g.20518  ORF Transcript_7884/g.20518 Transcript_7884/m.20518 type:complete len:268 (+) Transcript_7884:122-925(+)
MAELLAQLHPTTLLGPFMDDDHVHKVSDMQIAIYITAFFVFGRLFLDRLILEPVGKKLLHNSADVEKFPENFFKIVSYSLLFIYTYSLATHAEYYYDTVQCWTNIPQPISLEMKVWYMVQFSFNAHSFFYALFFQHKKSDYKVLLVHHIVTLFLIGGSYMAGYWRIGHLKLLVNDFADIFIAIAKVIGYLSEARKGIWKTMAPLFYVLMVLAWASTRIFVVAGFVMKSSMLESYEFVPFSHWCFFNALLSTLFVLYVYWLYLMLKVG